MGRSKKIQLQIKDFVERKLAFSNYVLPAAHRRDLSVSASKPGNQALVYDIQSPITDISGYTTDFVGDQAAAQQKGATEITSGVITSYIAYASTNTTKII